MKTNFEPAAFDFFHLDQRLSNQQRALGNRVRDFVENVVKPNINPYWEKAEFPWDIVRQMRDLPIWGGTLSDYGCASLDALSLGLVRYELAKGDGSIGTFYGVQSSLAMMCIGLLGSEEQKGRWLPALGRLEKIGAFALTEPDHGSDAVGIETTAQRDGPSYILNGAKRWIGNASIADVLIVWARDEQANLGGFVIEDPQHREGVTITDLQGKIGKRAILNADIKLEQVQIPAENRLARVQSFHDTATVLGYGRYGITWEAAGIGAAVFEMALDYAKKRVQFGKPIASFQLVQQKLVEMATEVSLMQLLCFRLAELMAAGEYTHGMLSMGKYNNARKARYITQLAREIFGANGMLIENHVGRLMMDAEAIYTYEGTNEINLLLVGRELTGLNAIQS